MSWSWRRRWADGLDPSRMDRDTWKVLNPAAQVWEWEAVGRMEGWCWQASTMWYGHQTKLSCLQLKEMWCLELGYDSLHALCWPDHVFQKWQEVLGHTLGGTEVNWSLFVRNRKRDQIHVMHNHKRSPAVQPGIREAWVSRWQAPWGSGLFCASVASVPLQCLVPRICCYYPLNGWVIDWACPGSWSLLSVQSKELSNRTFPPGLLSMVMCLCQERVRRHKESSLGGRLDQWTPRIYHCLHESGLFGGGE